MSRSVRTCAVALGIAFTPTAAMAQLVVYQYAAKFICGKPVQPVVAPGVYFTAVNVRNTSSAGVAFRKRFVAALPSEKPGPVTGLFAAKLGPDQAFEVDCPDITRQFQGNPTFLKGFVVIEATVELDVVAVYTAAGSTGQVETLHIEHISPRSIRSALADLVPVPDPQFGFCKTVKDGPDKGKLIVTVRNQGAANAPASTATVAFSPGGSFTLPTPPLAPGASVDLTPLAIPGVCFDPDCNFRITVDSGGVVVESNEANNSGVGSCIG